MAKESVLDSVYLSKLKSGQILFKSGACCKSALGITRINLTQIPSSSSAIQSSISAESQEQLSYALSDYKNHRSLEN
jgi:hypothetical protein